MKKITQKLQKIYFLIIFSLRVLLIGFVLFMTSSQGFAQAARPVITIENEPLSYTEGQVTPLKITNTLTITDDNVNIQGAIVRVGANSLNTEDRLNYSNANGITGVWDANTSTLRLSGTASIANYQTALRSITYQNTNNVNPYTGTRRITFAVTDGTSYSDATVDNSGVKSRNIEIIPVNNSPAATTDNYNVIKNTAFVQALSGGVLSNDIDLDSYRSNNLVITQTPTAPTLDGIEEALWSSASSRQMNNKLYGSEPSNSLNGSGYFKTMWDATNLYVLVRVYDNIYINDSPEPWQDDAVEIFIDGNNAKSAGRDLNDLQYVFGNGDTDFIEYHQGNRKTGVTFGRASTVNGYITEIKIPWSTIQVAPAANNAIGLDIHIADDDNGGDRDLKRTWNDPYDWSYTSPSHYGTAMLGSQVSSMTATVVTAPTNGTLTLNPNGSFTYTPNSGYIGNDNFIYRVCDNSSPNYCVNGTANIVVTTPGAIAGNQSICSGDDPVAFTSTEAALTYCTFSTYQWQSSTNNVNFTNISGATSATYNAPAVTQTTYYRRGATDACNTTYTTPVTVTVTTTPPGDPAVFGNNVWNVYAYKSKNFANYGGYYTEGSSSILNFNSQSLWGQTLSPSTPANTVSGYQGCQIPVDNHSISYKRKGFPTGTYQIGVTSHDDAASLLINGIQVWNHNGCCDAHSNVWIGNLDANSTIEFRWEEDGGNSYGSLNFTTVVPTTLNGGTIGTSQSICSGDNPIAFTSTALASGGCYINGYQWQSSTNNVNFTNISGATATTYDAPAVTQTTYYRRAVIDACNNTVYSNTVTVSIYGSVQGDPTVFGNNIWHAYAYKSNDFTNYGGYYTQGSTTELSFDSEDLWAESSSPSNSQSKVSNYLGCQIPTNYHSISYKRKGFPVGTYQIDVTSHDDEAFLYVNGILVWNHYGWGDTHGNVWTGNLDATSTIEFKWSEGIGESYGSLRFTSTTPSNSVLAGSISDDQSICYGGNPAAFTSTATGSSTCYVYYQWQSSSDNNTYTDITGATSATYDAPNGLTATTYYRRKATDACGNIAYTSPLTVTIYANNTAGSMWIGGFGSDWNNAANWCGGIPTATSDVAINSGMPNMPIISSAAVCRNITISNGASLTIANSNSLSVHGIWTNNGTFTPNTGTVIYASTGAQTISPDNYYNLQSSSTGSRTLSSSGTIYVGGAFIPGTNSYTITESTLNFNGADGQTIAAFGYDNLTTSGVGSKLLSGNTTVNGYLTSSSLDLNGRTLTINGYVPQTTRLKGSVNSNLILASSASFESSLSFVAGFEQLLNLTINTSDDDISLGTPLTVFGHLTFPASGYVTTSTVNILTLAANATYSGNSAVSFVKGPMAKIMSSASKFIFPIGKENLERKVAILPSNGSTTTFTAEYFSASPLTISTNIETPALHHISEVEYWNIEKSGSADAKIELFWGFESNVSMNEPDLHSLRITHYNHTTVQWENRLVTLTAGSSNSAGSIITEDYQSDFSPFTFAS
ncbi:MAG TPA: sugar-binding protein, partial [Cytophagales bacterium]|nr:sugar-binding protein [Cytophagales bacterium]